MRLADKDPFLRRAAAEGLGRAHDSSELSALEIGAGNDASEMVRAAMAFALQKLGRNYIPRLVESLDSDKMAPQVADYLLELGPSFALALVPHLQDPSPAIRANVATVLGALGDATTVTALQPLTGDKDRGVAQAATRAIERIKHPRANPEVPLVPSEHDRPVARFLRASDPRCRARAHRQGPRARHAGWHRVRCHRRNRGLHRRIRSGVSRRSRSDR